jgi:hypothetical protein
MTQAILRALQPGDLPALAPIDDAFVARVGVAAMAERAVLTYYARSGHAFVRERAGEVTGFVLAHAVWDGAHPVVRVARVAARDDDPETVVALIDGVVKSAYDAGVYRLVAEVPEIDRVTQEALRGVSFAPSPTLRFERRLGSGVLAGSRS